MGDCFYEMGWGGKGRGGEGRGGKVGILDEAEEGEGK